MMWTWLGWCIAMTRRVGHRLGRVGDPGTFGVVTPGFDELVWRCSYGDDVHRAWLTIPYQEGKYVAPPLTVTVQYMMTGSEELFELALIEQSLVSSSSSILERERE